MQIEMKSFSSIKDSFEKICSKFLVRFTEITFLLLPRRIVITPSLLLKIVQWQGMIVKGVYTRLITSLGWQLSMVITEQANVHKAINKDIKTFQTNETIRMSVLVFYLEMEPFLGYPKATIEE